MNFLISVQSVLSFFMMKPPFLYLCKKINAMNKVLFSVSMLMTFSLSCMANEQKSLGPCGCGYATCSLPSDLKENHIMLLYD